MRKKRPAEFDDLIAAYYGSGIAEVDPRQRAEDLFATYYGTAPGPKSRRASLPSVSLSLGCDDGEIISPRNRPQRSSAQRTTVRSNSLDVEEYIIDVLPSAEIPPEPLAEAPAESRAGVAPVANRAAERASGDFRSTAPASPSPSTQPYEPAPKPGETASSLSATESDIIDDLQAIIRGQKIYDKEMGMVDRSTAPQRASGVAGGNGASSTPPAKNGQEIFDRIAQSMQYANAYDLGTVELENRFADFDRQEDRRRTGGLGKKAEPKAIAPASAEQPDTADFIEDLDAIKSDTQASASRSTSIARTQTRDSSISRPFYDSGEHVLAGGTLYEERLHVGKGAGVPFSYGQLIAMADLYESVDQMMAADVGELQRIKALIQRTTSYYQGKRRNPSLDVSNDEWEQVTHGRYLKLAEDNYEHFSPATVAMGRAPQAFHGDNKSQWESYHKRAIEAAQKQYLATNGKVSIFFEWPLTLNAFGDHFLTDAFAAGHLINKGVMIEQFKANFFDGDSLKDAGEDFFENVADAAWQGEVERQFSRLETVDWAHWHGIPLPFHPDINSASRFGKVLKAAANEEPDRVANLIVKALHDRLNSEGIEVTNRAGDGSWILPGDGTMTVGSGRLTPTNLSKNLDIMRKAVQQSVDDINSPSIRADNLNFRSFMDGVWRYVPELTPTSRQQMSALIRDYTTPTSAVLVKAAADILNEQLKSFIKVLIDEHKLQPA